MGQNQSVGSNKQIIWDVLQDRDQFQGDWIFGIEAINVTLQKRKDRKDKRKYSSKFPNDQISFMTEPSIHSPFGLTYLKFIDETKLGFFIGGRSDFGLFINNGWHKYQNTFLPSGSWYSNPNVQYIQTINTENIKTESWILNNTDCIKADNEYYFSYGGNTFNFGLSVGIINNYKWNIIMSCGLGYSTHPVYSSYKPFATNPNYNNTYYSKIFPDVRFNQIFGLHLQSKVKAISLSFEFNTLSTTWYLGNYMGLFNFGIGYNW